VGEIKIGAQYYSFLNISFGSAGEKRIFVGTMDELQGLGNKYSNLKRDKYVSSGASGSYKHPTPKLAFATEHCR